MKGIILAGGLGTRLYPLTKSVSKQLLPVYDKPMIYYPISIFMLAKINDILIITKPEDKIHFQKLLEDGSQFGLKFSYLTQSEPNGLAEAFILGKDFIQDDSVCLILGDNIIYGQGLTSMLEKAKINTESSKKAVIFGYYVNNPEDYGVADLDNEGNIKSIEEKPKNPKSNIAIPGIYFYPNDVVFKVKNVTRSSRGELEITSLNELYLDEGLLDLYEMGRGYIWFDTGSHESLKEASDIIQSFEKRQGKKIACLEEIAYKKGLISKISLEKQLKKIGDNAYSNYLKKILN